MAIELTMPALSPTMEKGTLARWLVTVGDIVNAGDMIAEVETDKATMEIEAEEGGCIVSIVVPAGTEDVPVGTVIASLGAKGEVASSQNSGKDASVEKVENASAVTVTAEPTMVLPAPPEIDRTVNATPLARRIAAIRDISLGTVTGTGPKGKIVKADLGIGPLIRPPSTTGTQQLAVAIAPPPEGVPLITEKLSSMRKTIARRLTESKSTVPHFYLTAKCRLDPLLALRADLNGSLAGRGVKLSVNDLLIKSLAKALQLVPEANVQFGGEVLHRFERVDVSMAVAIDGGLITPVIRDAGSKSVSTIAEESKSLAQKARDGQLTPADYAGGTVSISNLGMYGIDEMVPVINPPQALILGVGSGVRQPWEVNGDIALATILAATASFDHRAIDGAVAAQFMAAMRDLIEDPIVIVA